MKACFFMVVILCLMCGVSRADVIHLKNGNTVEGKVVEKTADGIKVDIGGVMLTYYSDEVASIDAVDQPVLAGAPAAEAEAVAPAAAVAEAPALEPAAEIAIEAPSTEPVAEPVSEVVPAPAVMSDELTNMSKEDLIKKFVQIYGVKENMQTNFDQMTATLKPDQAEAFRKSVKVDEIVDLLLPIYDKHFTADDLRAYIRFYSSGEGRKLVQTLPLLMKDSVDISMKYLDERLPESLKQAEAASSGN